MVPGLRQTIVMTTLSIPGGFLIAIEGIDGVGKSTLARSMHAILSAGNVRVHLSKEPTDSPWGARLRASAEHERLPPEDELRLLLKDRRQHVDDVIAPALRQGDIVILDRYFFSTAAYQAADDMGVEDILATNRAFAPEPDLLFVLDVDPSVGVARIGKRGDKPNSFETERTLSRCRTIFNAIDSAVRIDASGHEADVLQVAMDEVFARIASKAR